MAVDLVFNRSPYTSQPVDLVFGDDGEISIPPVYAEAYMVVPVPVFSAVGQYNNRVQRYMGVSTKSLYEVSEPMAVEKAGLYARGGVQDYERPSGWSLARGASRDYGVTSERPLTISSEQVPLWGVSDHVGYEAQDRIQIASRVQAVYEDLQLIALPVGHTTFVRSQAALLLPGVSPSLHYQVATKAGRALLLPVGGGVGVSTSKTAGVVPWQVGRYPPPGFDAPPDSGVTPQPPFQGSTDLLFQCPVYLPGSPVVLVFGGSCDIELPPVIVTRVYRIMNSLQLIRVSDGVPVLIDNATVTYDKDSWGWRFSATLRKEELPKVEPGVGGPVEVQLTINSFQWRFLVEDYTLSEEFQKSGVTISGRSLTALLDSPYVLARSLAYSSALTTSQMADQEITRVGVPPGFTLDWQLVDSLGWPVPANVYSFSNLTPIQVVKALAESVGGYVASNRTLKQVQVRSSYPSLPWEWAGSVPDVVLPSSLVVSRSLSWDESPPYTGVYVSGESGSNGGLVRRAGTDGSILAQQYVHPLITHPSAVVEYGRSILGAAGKKARMTLKTPMHPDIGLISVGNLLSQTDGASSWRGLVRAVSITASWAQKSLTVAQTVEVERHY